MILVIITKMQTNKNLIIYLFDTTKNHKIRLAEAHDNKLICFTNVPNSIEKLLGCSAIIITRAWSNRKVSML